MKHPSETPRPLVVRPDQLKEIVGFGRVTAWRLEQDPSSNFPRRRKLTPGGSVFYLYSEIQEYLENCEQV